MEGTVLAAHTSRAGSKSQVPEIETQDRETYKLFSIQYRYARTDVAGATGGMSNGGIFHIRLGRRV